MQSPYVELKIFTATEAFVEGELNHYKDIYPLIN